MKKSGKRTEGLIIQDHLSERIKKLKIPVQQIIVSVLAFVLCAFAFLRSSIHEPVEFAGRLIIYIIMYCITIFLCSRQDTKRKLANIEVY